MTPLQQAIEWRKKFGRPIPETHPGCENNEDCILLQRDLIEEEATETDDAIWDLVENIAHLSRDVTSPSDVSRSKRELLKELADLVFVAYQLAALLGLDLDEAVNRVFVSNMSKVDDNGNPIFNEKGKIMKGPNYQPPNLEDLVQ